MKQRLVGSEERPMGMEDLPNLENWTLHQLEDWVKGWHLTPELRAYMGQCWRVCCRSEAFDPAEPGSACAGFVSLEPPPRAAVELGRELAKKYGWSEGAPGA